MSQSSQDGGPSSNRNWLSGPINPWLIVLGCVLVNFFSIGTFAIYGINIFLIDRLVSFDWSISTGSLLVSALFFGAGFGQLVLSSSIDRFGIRGPAIVLATIYLLFLASITVVPLSLPVLLTVFFLIGLAGGGAASAMPFSIAITGFISRNRGLAFGLGATGASIGAALTPGFSHLLVGAFGWQSGLLVYLVIAFVVILFAMIFLLRTPPAVMDKSASATAFSSASYLRLIDSVLVIIISILAINAFCAVGILVNIVPLMHERGVSTGAAAAILSVAGLSSWFGRVIVGWLLDRVFAPYVTFGTLVSGALGTVLLLYGGAGPTAYAGAILVGLCMGAEADLAMYLVSRYFPLSVYSKVAGMAWLAWAWGGALGTLLAARLYDVVQDYDLVLWFFAFAFAVAAVLALMLPAYRVSTSGDDMTDEARS